jgi:hypothetical protein
MFFYYKKIKITALDRRSEFGQIPPPWGHPSLAKPGMGPFFTLFFSKKTQITPFHSNFVSIREVKLPPLKTVKN